MTPGETLLETMGCDLFSADGFDLEPHPLPRQLEDQVHQTLDSWSKFCTDMAAWYVKTFAKEPIILIGSPTMEMCMRHQLPTHRSFIVRTLSRMIADIGNDRSVGIVDCKHDPLTDPWLADQANHWVAEFARHDHLPRIFAELANRPKA